MKGAAEMYLSHDDYKSMGGTIEDAALYKRYAARADALLDRMTHGRVSDETPVRPCMQYAAFALIDAMHSDAQSGAEGREIASVSNDGVSVSFTAPASAASAGSAARYAGIARQYLEWETDSSGTLLLYAGVEA